MSDLISRQAAIDALEKVAELYPWRVPGDRDSYSQYNEAWQDALNRADMRKLWQDSKQRWMVCRRGNKMPDRRTLYIAERWVLPFVGEKERNG